MTPAFGLHYGSPMRISGAAGVIIDLNTHSLDGILLLTEPGQLAVHEAAGDRDADLVVIHDVIRPDSEEAQALE